MTHYNHSNGQSISGTHWQFWPDNEAIPDASELNHLQWLDAFLKRANIRLKYGYRPPPYGEQLKLPV